MSGIGGDHEFRGRQIDGKRAGVALRGSARSA
jgi:hypothetical protein